MLQVLLMIGAIIWSPDLLFLVVMHLKSTYFYMFCSFNNLMSYHVINFSLSNLVIPCTYSFQDIQNPE